MSIFTAILEKLRLGRNQGERANLNEVYSGTVGLQSVTVRKAQ